MSICSPSAALVFGAITPSQGDILDLKVHLGCSKEVSSFEVRLQNWDGQYSPNCPNPISVGMDGSISLGRGASCPLLLTCRVESVNYKSTPKEHYINIAGRCWGEKLFRYTVSEQYESQKGEDIVNDLIDYYAGLNHNRSGTELIENTDTTYTNLDYKDSPVWDILKYIAETADKSGVIGYDFRVAPDGRFEFFPKNSRWWAENGLQLYLPFDEGSGATAYDHSNKGNNGILINAVWVTGKFGGAVEFNGPGAKVTVVHDESIAFTSGDFTISYWVKLDAVSGKVHLCKGNANTPSGQGWYIQEASNNRIAFSSRQAGANQAVFTTSNALVIGSWVMLTFTRTSSVGLWYVNGVESTGASSPLVDPAVTTKNLIIGDYDTGGFSVDGLIDDVRIFNRVLSQSEIQEYCSSGPPPLSQKVEVSEYRKDIFRVRNKIMIYGVADKSVPASKVDWTRSLTPAAGVWTASVGVLDLGIGPDGGNCIELYAENLYSGSCTFTLNAGQEVNTELYPVLDVTLKVDKTFTGSGALMLLDAANKTAIKNITVAPGSDNSAWHLVEVGVSSAYAGQWENIEAGFDWTQIKKVAFSFPFPAVGTGYFYIHALNFGGRRYSALREDAASQAAFGTREYVETDEELFTDNECDLRAKAILNYLKSPAEYLTLRSTVIDYGSTPILAGDVVHVNLPNENVDADFRVESVEYQLLDECQTLEITLELGKEPPQIADYLYGMRTFTVNVEKLSRTKLGKRGIPVAMQSGGVGSHQNSHTRGGIDGVQWDTPLSEHGGWDPIDGWISPSHIGPWNDGPSYVYFRTGAKGGGILDHVFCPSDDLHGIFGYANKHWKEVHSQYHFAPDTGFFRIRTVTGGVPDAQPKAELGKDALQFGPGGVTAVDSYIKRISPNVFEFYNKLVPTADGAGYLGQSDKRIQYVYAAHLDGTDLYAGGFLVVTSGRVLQNVSADAGVITSGQFAIGRLTRGTAGFVLEAQGAGSDPVYVNPNNRYMPATHNQSAESINSGGVSGDVAVARVGGGTRTLHFANSRYTGYTDS